MHEDAPGQANPPRQATPPPPLDYNTYTPPKDTRTCGCTVHIYHGDCFQGCESNHCGYRLAQVMRMAKMEGPTRIDLYLSDRTPPSPHQQAETAKLELREWWGELAADEADQVVAKAIEYGSRDLVEIGRDLARCMGREISDQDAAELGVYFYLRGKLARWTEAVADGRTVSDDTLKDIGVYVRMAQRIRSHGGWPGVKA